MKQDTLVVLSCRLELRRRLVQAAVSQSVVVLEAANACSKQLRKLQKAPG
jgi:hypothetical protein